ncbi:MAG: TolB family protein, partial [Blastocatellia bacterium]
VAPEQVSSLNQLAISPDGRNLAFNGSSAGKNQLWVRPIDSLIARPLPGTEGINSVPFWSPDSRAIAFLLGGKLKKIDLADGTQQTLCDFQSSARGFGGAWNRAGDILIFRSPTIYRVAATGGTPTPVPGLDPKVECRWPWFLPDGQHFLYLASSTQQENAEVFLASLDGKVNKRLLAADSSASYAASAAGERWLFFARSGTLLAQPFDARRLALTGEPVRVAASVRTSPNRVRHFSVSDNGTVVYQPSRGDEDVQLAWVDRAGKALGPVGAPGYVELPRLSPDGKQVAVSRRELGGNTDIYVIDLVRNVSTRLTFDPEADDYPIWSPDGTRIVWYSRREGNRGLYQKPASGVGQDELLLKSDVLLVPYHWSADGKFISYIRFDPQTKADLWVLLLDAASQPVPFLQTPFSETRGRFSPDGRWITYTSDESGKNEIYVQTFPASGGKWQVSTQGGEQSYWRGDGKELYYLSGDGKMMAVAVNSGSTFAPGLPQALFDLKAARPVPGSSYTVTNDGQRFLFIRQVEETNRLQYNVVVNWTAEAKK